MVMAFGGDIRNYSKGGHKVTIFFGKVWTFSDGELNVKEDITRLNMRPFPYL